MTRPTVTAALLALLVSTVPAGAQVAPATPASAPGDARWSPFLGCWRAVDDPAGVGARICVSPSNGGALVTTVVGGQRVSTDTRIADGTAHAVDADGCRGTETVRWSASGHRLYRNATIACDGGAPRTLATASFFAAGPVWVDVETVEAEGTTNVRVSRLVRAASQLLPDGTTIARPAGARGPSAEAMASFTVADVIELSQALPADGVQAAIAEAPSTYRLNAKALVAMAEAGVGDRVIDLMVGLTYPARFEVRRAASGGWGGGGLGMTSMADPFFSPLIGPAALFNCYSSYGWAAANYWGSCSGYDPRLMTMFPGYYNGYYGAFGPGWIVTQPGIGVGGPTTPLEPAAEGRLVNGRGYTQVRPIETTSGFNSDGSRNSGMGSNGSSGNSGSSGSSGSAGVSGSGYSGGGGGGDRMAVPRGPGGDR